MEKAWANAKMRNLSGGELVYATVEQIEGKNNISLKSFGQTLLFQFLFDPGGHPYKWRTQAQCEGAYLHALRT